ncbi:MAG: alanine--tRNA ligase [Archangium gephyra]|uniref:Alanine--tRNA ligase n=1 Tax=Archangium gephyra TaxID=48 RepID=A0A2W5V6E9_9BACT|nr:MAG: alanine--tRNA ligase [Archangium gephyra]
MSSQLTASEIREAFLKFFESHQHRRVASSSLVPANDPTLLFTNAGMVQFKDVFTGRETRDYQRATTTQKCVRAGGKHNDLDNVGFTARHHTFFEMLGNFSFGDYFKADAVKWAWDFVTKELKIPVERLSVTVFKGEDGIPADDEAAKLWVEAGVPAHRVHRLGKADNFWSMGDTGACGPCSEIYVYLPEGAVDEANKPGESDAWLEIWNLVFMQFERKADGSLVNLPKPSIDTGAGLERVTAYVQGKKSNYDTDLFTPLFAAIEKLSGKKYGATWGPKAVTDAAMRVIADHARATAFLVADGVQPSNEGRGYVLRRIMRRAIRHGDQHLDLSEPFFGTVVDAVIDAMSGAYPELKEKRQFLLEVAKHEEDSFRRTLKRGLGLIATELEKLRKSNAQQLGGSVVWDLHQTYGFPWDLTEVIAREEGFGIDKAGFEKLLDEERERASQRDLSSEKGIADIYMKLASSISETKFLGYDGTTGTGKVVALISNGQQVPSAKAGDSVEVVFDQSPFYGESGGQVGDTGTITGQAAKLVITDAQKPAGGLIVHKGKVTEGAISVGDTLNLSVDAERRQKIRANHSATHLLHKALKVVLGETVNQKGSIVQPEFLRFDFSTFTPMTQEQIDAVEDLVNGWVRDNQGADTRIMGINEAKAAGAVALFGEKYGEKVRVVSVHPESTELCGGTHVSRSGDIGYFRIQTEASIASGVRRIVALTGAAAAQYAREQEKVLHRSAELYKATAADLPKRIETSQKRIKDLEKKLEELQLKASAGGAKSGENVQEINGVKVLTQRIDPADASVFKQLADRYRDQLKSGVIGLGGETSDGKALILVAATKDLVEKGFKAGDAVRVMAAEIGGKGGGKPDMAQAGGTDPSKISQAFDKLFAQVRGA